MSGRRRTVKLSPALIELRGLVDKLFSSTLLSSKKEQQVLARQMQEAALAIRVAQLTSEGRLFYNEFLLPQLEYDPAKREFRCKHSSLLAAFFCPLKLDLGALFEKLYGKPIGKEISPKSEEEEFLGLLLTVVSSFDDIHPAWVLYFLSRSQEDTCVGIFIDTLLPYIFTNSRTAVNFSTAIRPYLQEGQCSREFLETWVLAQHAESLLLERLPLHALALALFRQAIEMPLSTTTHSQLSHLNDETTELLLQLLLRFSREYLPIKELHCSILVNWIVKITYVMVTQSDTPWHNILKMVHGFQKEGRGGVFFAKLDVDEAVMKQFPLMGLGLRSIFQILPQLGGAALNFPFPLECETLKYFGLYYMNWVIQDLCRQEGDIRLHFVLAPHSSRYLMMKTVVRTLTTGDTCLLNVEDVIHWFKPMIKEVQKTYPEKVWGACDMMLSILFCVHGRKIPPCYLDFMNTCLVLINDAAKKAYTSASEVIFVAWIMNFQNLILIMSPDMVKLKSWEETCSLLAQAYAAIGDHWAAFQCLEYGLRLTNGGSNPQIKETFNRMLQDFWLTVVNIDVGYGAIDYHLSGVEVIGQHRASRVGLSKLVGDKVYSRGPRIYQGFEYARGLAQEQASLVQAIQIASRGSSQARTELSRLVAPSEGGKGNQSQLGKVVLQLHMLKQFLIEFLSYDPDEFASYCEGHKAKKGHGASALQQTDSSKSAYMFHQSGGAEASRHRLPIGDESIGDELHFA